MKHVWLKHTNCEDMYCPICEGGLAQCVVCGGAECELPRECPGVAMTPYQRDRVCQGILDYRDGTWEMLPGTELGITHT